MQSRDNIESYKKTFKNEYFLMFPSRDKVEGYQTFKI